MAGERDLAAQERGVRADFAEQLLRRGRPGAPAARTRSWFRTDGAAARRRRPSAPGSAPWVASTQSTASRSRAAGAFSACPSAAISGCAAPDSLAAVASIAWIRWPAAAPPSRAILRPTRSLAWIAVGAFIDRRDAGVAEMLGGAGFLDEAHAAMNLHASRGDLDRALGAPALHHRDQQIDQRLRCRGLVLVGRGLARCPSGPAAK